jgi:hypothetical protein
MAESPKKTASDLLMGFWRHKEISEMSKRIAYKTTKIWEKLQPEI